MYRKIFSVLILLPAFIIGILYLSKSPSPENKTDYSSIKVETDHPLSIDFLTS